MKPSKRELVRLYVTNRCKWPLQSTGTRCLRTAWTRRGLTQPYIKPGETAKYEFTLRQCGTFMFHSHHDEMTQMGMGLIGLFVIHPRNPAPRDPWTGICADAQYMGDQAGTSPAPWRSRISTS